MAKTLWYMFGGTIVIGFFLAIFILTGTSVEPTDLALIITGQVVQATNNPQVTSFWSTATGIIAIIGMVEIVKDVISYILFGWPGVIVASSGFLGTLLLLLGGSGLGIYAGLFLLFIGAIICFAFEGSAPKDFISRNI